jgi:hypothetical protein
MNIEAMAKMVREMQESKDVELSPEAKATLERGTKAHDQLEPARKIGFIIGAAIGAPLGCL